ncbi:uncharacterized protein LOC135835745 [Planococcus citri]|uniref:uncharacterized protein LOC135835745 n=1 Tax=Planococcus citri TaxID=170843 RepID=UPI0031F81FFD
MDSSFRNFTWILCLVFLCGLINADDSFTVSDLSSNTAASDDKPQFPSLENLKSIRYENGYSGVLIPERTIDKAEAYLENIGVDKGILEYIKTLIPKTAKALFKFILKAGAVAVTAVLVLLITSSIATAFCSYSELCSISYFNSLGWQKRGLEESVRAFITPEKMSYLGSFVHNAISKYENLNRKKSKSL